MAQCCDSNCGSCGGCGRQLLLTQEECNLLETLGQIPFLPVARRRQDMTPVYLEEADDPPARYSAVLQALEQKGLISIDYDKPLRGCDMGAYSDYEIHGSFALTAYGQRVVDQLQRQGISPS